MCDKNIFFNNNDKAPDEMKTSSMSQPLHTFLIFPPPGIPPTATLPSWISCSMYILAKHLWNALWCFLSFFLNLFLLEYSCFTMLC